MTRAASEALLRNIGPGGVGKRRKAALVAAAVALAALIALDVLDLPHRWRAFLFVPLWFAALCHLQAAAETSVRLASRGVRDLDDEQASEIRDDELAGALRRQGRRLHVQALLLAALLTAIVFLTPL